MRGIAALSIIWLHTFVGGPWSKLSFPGRYAVPFFTASAVFLIFQSVSRRPGQFFGSYALSRFKRIYVPFAIWTVIYLIVMSIASAIKHSPMPSINVQLLWVGSTHHLWFLPYILGVSLLSFLVARLPLKGLTALLMSVGFFIIGSVLALKWFPIRLPDDYCLWLAMDTLPSMFWTWALLIELQRRRQTLGPNVLRATFTVVIWIGCLVSLVWLDRHRGMENVAGFAAFIFAMSIHWQAPRYLVQLGTMAYGIYLVHILFLEGFQDIAAMAQVPDSLMSDLMTIIVATVCSIAFCAIVSRLPGCQWLGVEPTRIKKTASQHVTRG